MCSVIAIKFCVVTRLQNSIETRSGQPVCPGHLGQTCFKNYLGLDHMQCEIKEYVVWRCKNAGVRSL